MKHMTGTRRAMRRLRDLDARLGDLPIKGHHVGGGRHVELGDTPGPGWTIYRYGVRRHPTKSLWAYPIDTALIAARTAKAATMTVAEEGELDDAIAGATALDATWDEKTAEVTARAIA